jgi:hypothetical protein
LCFFAVAEEGAKSAKFSLSRSAALEMISRMMVQRMLMDPLNGGDFP